MAEVAFSEDGKYYSAISQDGRLRIWDTESNVLKQEYTPDLHLTSPPSCLQWINVALSSCSPKKGAKKKQSYSETEVQCIALGTTSGKILIYSVAQAKIETVLVDDKNKEIHNTKITTLDWHRKYGFYSCNKDNTILEWDLQNASVRNKYNINVDSKNKQANRVSAIKIVPHNQETRACYLVAASWQIRVWRLNDGTAVVVKCLGHSSAPRALLSITTLNNRSWVIEGSQTERLLSFWDVTITSEYIPQVNGDDITPSKKQRKKSITEGGIVTTPTYNFVLEDAPKVLDVNVTEDAGTKLRLAAATRSGVVHYYDHMLNGPSGKPIKPSVTIQITTPDANPLPLHCCRLPPYGDLLLGYASGPAMLFERVTPDLKTKTQVLIRGEPKETKKRSKQHTNEINKVRSDPKQDTVTYVEPMGGISRKRTTPGGKIEVPMEERLSNLALDSRSRGKSAVNQNLTKLLVQGLHSKDKGLILTVLQKDDPAVASRTVANLPADYVPLLLEQLADMATRKTSQCASVCTWLTCTLRCHSALLLATVQSGPASETLARLLAVFTHRRSHLCQLLNLKGRMEMTTSQRKSQDEQLQEQEPILTYNDTSSDEEMELDRYQSESDHEMWGERTSDADEPSDSGGDGE